MEPQEEQERGMSLGNSSASSSTDPVSSAAAPRQESPDSNSALTTMSQSLSSDSQDQGDCQVTTTTPTSLEGLNEHDHDLIQACIAADDFVKMKDVDVDDFLLKMEDEDLTGPNDISDKIVDMEGMIAVDGSGVGEGGVEMAFESMFNIKMTATEIQNHCKESAINLEMVTNMSILGWKVPPPQPPEAPSMKLSEEQLHPWTPCVVVETARDAFSRQLHNFCLEHQIAVVRGMPTAMKMDLGVFSTKKLVEADPDYPIDVLEQYLQPGDENLDIAGNGGKSWKCDFVKTDTTVLNYAKYQVYSFDEDKKSSGKIKMRKKMIKFGTNLDLTDDPKWNAQLLELQKLPPFLRVYAPGMNMLSYVGHDILGMNTVQVYMKVPGSRTSGHQENNNFCSVNVNIGPGDCEWFAVPDAYWGEIERLCEKNNIMYLHEPWWPDLKDCAEAGIPVYRFKQKPGDFVWVNCGCVHWVQALGFCNNVAWNVGPLTAGQYQMAVQRYEWNKVEGFKSIVPMINLSWNLARSLRFSDQDLFERVKKTLVRTLVQCFKLLDFARRQGIKVRFYGKQKSDASLYCGLCLVEVFNLLFVREQRKPIVHCIDCALKVNQNLKGFVCLEEYAMEELMQVYDNFVLHQVVPIPPPVVVEC